MLSQLIPNTRSRSAGQDAVQRHLEKLLASPGFRPAPRLQAFLRFVVEHSLAGRNGEIKESCIGVEVYGKRPGYDSRIDSTVRVEAAKLRQRLAEYYQGEGAADPIRISIPKGAYVATIEIAPSPPPSRRLRHSVLASIPAAIAVVGGLAYWAQMDPPQSFDPHKLRMTRLTEASAFASDPALSSDGLSAIYTAVREPGAAMNLWTQRLDGGAASRLTRSTSNHSMPTVSRSGRIVFRTDEEGGSLATISQSGTLLVTGTARARHPRFSPQGEVLAYWVPEDEETLDHGRVYLQDLADRRSEPTHLFGEFAHARQPVWVGPGTHVLVMGTWQSGPPGKEYDAWVVALEGLHSKGSPIKTGLLPKLRAGNWYATLSERRLIEVGDWKDGWLYFTVPSGESVDLHRIRLDPSVGTVAGEPQRITFGSATAHSPRVTSEGMMFTDAETSYDLFSLEVPREGQSARDLRKHTSETGVNLRPSVHPTGNWMAWEKRRPGVGDQIWFHHLATGQRHRLGAGEKASLSHVLLAPDGRSAAYRVQVENAQPIFVESVTGGTPLRICPNCGAPSDWSPDGSHLWYITGGAPARVGLLDLKTGANRDSLRHPSYSLYGARQHVNATGDGWLAFYVDNGPRSRQIYLAPMRAYEPGGPETWVAATDGAHWDLSPAWAPDGNTLYFVSRRHGFSCILAQRLDPLTKLPRGEPWTVHHFHQANQSLMRTIANRGSDALWLAGGRLYFMLESTTSSLRMLSDLFR